MRYQRRGGYVYDSSIPSVDGDFIDAPSEIRFPSRRGNAGRAADNRPAPPAPFAAQMPFNWLRVIRISSRLVLPAITCTVCWEV